MSQFCSFCYASSKILIYYFMTEKVYIIRGSKRPRMKDPLYLFNALAMLAPYVGLCILNIYYRYARINQHGVCIIGMQRFVLIPLIVFDLLVNVWTTMLFIQPLRNLYTYRHGINMKLRTMAFRTFIGSCTTLASSIANLSLLVILDGEQAWICLLLCNLDVLASVLVLHWATTFDRKEANAKINATTGCTRPHVEEKSVVLSTRRATMAEIDSMPDLFDDDLDGPIPPTFQLPVNNRR
ncbi:hypothetical protein H2203_007498 [Taxawa tesnikishii (nom. ined.)]|nr:hypothetical protein H2203_007498 [Dothideales sp. JES 119]